jgi:hypothetical protein
MEYVDKPLDTICTKPWPATIFFAQNLNLSLSKRLCKKLKSQIPVVDSLAIQEELNKAYAAKNGSSGKQGSHDDLIKIFETIARALSARYWSGWSDAVQESNYTSIYTGEPIPADFRPFAAGEPNGGKIENCIVVKRGKNSWNWNDLPCSEPSYTFCHMKARPRFILRGEVTLYALQLRF